MQPAVKSGKPRKTRSRSRSAKVKLRHLTMDRAAAWSAANERVLAPTTAVIALITLQQICRYAVRRGWLAENPVTKLEPAEKPHWTPQQVAILEADELAALLDRAPAAYKFLFEFLAHTGLRIGEALGLTWADIDYDAGLVRVHRQLSRRREHRKPKTAAGKRDVILAPALARALRERWLASRYKAGTDFVFADTLGRGLDYRDVGEGFRQAVRSAGLARDGKRLSLHSLRHGYASLLIAKGLNVVFVSRQLGHANPNVTLEVHATCSRRPNTPRPHAMPWTPATRRSPKLTRSSGNTLVTEGRPLAGPPVGHCSCLVRA
jgi:integrase